MQIAQSCLLRLKWIIKVRLWSWSKARLQSCFFCWVSGVNLKSYFHHLMHVNSIFSLILALFCSPPTYDGIIYYFFSCAHWRFDLWSVWRRKQPHVAIGNNVANLCPKQLAEWHKNTRKAFWVHWAELLTNAALIRQPPCLIPPWYMEAFASEKCLQN